MKYRNATQTLRRRLGAKVVRTDAESLYAAGFDSSKILFSPEAVVFPRNEADIAAVLALANRHRVPVTVRGAGTTLIACEQLDRSCYCMELDAHYCDVIIKRWENFTGRKAEKIGG